MGVSYNRNVGLALDTGLAMLVVDMNVPRCGVAQTRIWSEMQVFSDPGMKWSTKLFRFALDLEHEVTQTRVGRDAELLKLTSNAGLLRPASEVSILLGIRGYVSVQDVIFALKWGSRLMTYPWWFLDSLQIRLIQALFILYLGTESAITYHAQNPRLA